MISQLGAGLAGTVTAAAVAGSLYRERARRRNAGVLAIQTPDGISEERFIRLHLDRVGRLLDSRVADGATLFLYDLR